MYWEWLFYCAWKFNIILLRISVTLYLPLTLVLEAMSLYSASTKPVIVACTRTFLLRCPPVIFALCFVSWVGNFQLKCTVAVCPNEPSRIQCLKPDMPHDLVMSLLLFLLRIYNSLSSNDTHLCSDGTIFIPFSLSTGKLNLPPY